MLRRKASALAVLALGTAACDPNWSGTGHVVDAAGKPVASATVSLVCPSGRSGSSKVDATGAFSFGGVGSAFEAPKCSVEIAAPGYVTRTVRTSDLCYRNTEDHAGTGPCKPGEGKLTLARAVVAPGAAPK